MRLGNKSLFNNQGNQISSFWGHTEEQRDGCYIFPKLVGLIDFVIQNVYQLFQLCLGWLIKNIILKWGGRTWDVWNLHFSFIILQSFNFHYMYRDLLLVLLTVGYKNKWNIRTCCESIYGDFSGP